jgi:hypothetical protein
VVLPPVACTPAVNLQWRCHRLSVRLPVLTLASIHLSHQPLPPFSSAASWLSCPAAPLRCTSTRSEQLRQLVTVTRPPGGPSVPPGQPQHCIPTPRAPSRGDSPSLSTSVSIQRPASGRCTPLRLSSSRQPAAPAAAPQCFFFGLLRILTVCRTAARPSAPALHTGLRWAAPVRPVEWRLCGSSRGPCVAYVAPIPPCPSPLPIPND